MTNTSTTPNAAAVAEGIQSRNEATRFVMAAVEKLRNPETAVLLYRDTLRELMKATGEISALAHENRRLRSRLGEKSALAKATAGGKLTAHEAQAAYAAIPDTDAEARAEFRKEHARELGLNRGAPSPHGVSLR